MSLYEMLPQKQPQTLPDTSDSHNDNAWLDPFSLLAEEALELEGELAFDEPQHALAGDAAAPGAEPPPDAGDENGLQAYIRAAFERKLPQITEYREKGYNLRGPDEGAVKKLQAALEKATQEPEVRVLAEPARRFLFTLQGLAINDPAMPPVLQETVLQANRLIQLLSTALEALAAGAKTGGLDWEAEAKKSAREQRAKLVAALPGADRAQQLQAEGLMFSESYRLGAEFKQFARLQDSLMAESRLVRHRLTGWLEENTTRIEEGARDIRESAINTLLAQATAKPSGTPEQLAAWGARFQEFARSLPGRDTEFDTRRLAGNPLAAAFSSVMNASADESAHVRLARAMLPVTAALGQASALLVRAQTRVALPETETNKVIMKPKLSLPEKARLAGRGVLTSTATLARKAGHRTVRGAFRTGHLARHLLHLTPDPEGLDRTVRNTGLLLLDEIQQTERQLGQLATQAWLLQEATEQQWRVQAETASLAPAMPELSALLAAELQKEATRWQLTGQQALVSLEGMLSHFARLTESGFYSELSDELQQAKALSEQKRFGDIAGMAGTMSGVAEGLGGIARGLDSAVIRLSEHGHAGGQELNTLLGSYRRQLSQLKAQVKTRVTGITGSSLASFSRGGMLARGVAEWAEALKQAWLAGLAPAQRADAATQFDQALMAVMEENRAHFAGSHDPQAEGFLKRLTLARRHAAAGTQIYPPTAEEILAGSRSVPEDLRRWAERKVLGGALWAVLRGGFNLVTGPVSLPLRVAIRGARTGYTLAGGLRQMNRVRLGAGPATEAKRRLVNQALAKIGIRLALSLSPVVGWSVAVTITAAEAGRKRHDTKALKKMVKRFALNIPEEGLWAGGYAGTRAAIEAVIRVRTEQAIREATEKMAADARAQLAALFGEQNDVDLLSLLAMADNDDDVTGTTDAEEDTADDDTDAVDSAGPATDPDEEAQETTVVEEGVVTITRQLKRVEPVVPLYSGLSRRGVHMSGGQNYNGPPPVQTANRGENEGEAEVPKRRGKRSAETDELKPSNYYYPAPNRETAIDAALERRILQIFPIKNGFRIPAKNATLSSPRQKVYRYEGSDFLYIGGRYRYIKFISQSEDGAWEAEVYPYQRPLSAQNQPFRIKFNIEDDRWHLADDAANGVKINPDIVTTIYVSSVDQQTSEEARQAPADNAYTYDQMLPGDEGQVYDDGANKYVFMGGRYWLIEFLDDYKFTIPAMNKDEEMYIYTASELQPSPKPIDPVKPALPETTQQTDTEDNVSVQGKVMPAQQGDQSSDKKSAAGPSVSQLLQTKAKRWLNAEASQTASSIAGTEGTVYKKSNGELSIFINNRHFPFIFVGTKAGAIFVEDEGKQKAIIIRIENNVWQYFGENNAENFRLFVSLLDKDNFDEDVKKEITSLLASEGGSWLDTLLNIKKAILKQFNRLYLQPTSKNLNDVLWLNFIISSYLSTSSASEGTAENGDLQWNESLLELYQAAFSVDVDDPVGIANAQHVFYLKDEAERKVKILNTASLEKNIADLNRKISINAEAINHHNVAIGNTKIEEVKDYLRRGLQKIQKQHDDLVKKRDALQPVLNELNKRKQKYQQEIKNYTAQFGTYWAGITLGKELFNRNRSLLSINASLSQIAVRSLVDLALQEVAITSKARTEYTESELSELKKIRVAKLEIKQLLFRQQAFESLLPLLEQSDIQPPEAKGNYQDILWANEQGERLSQSFSSSESTADNNALLPAILYWLVKFKKTVAEIKDENIEKIIDEYSNDIQKFNPLTQEKAVPEGYTPLSGMLGSEFFETQTEFNEQFSNYKEKYSSYDASERVKELLLLTGLSVEEVMQDVKKTVRLKISLFDKFEHPEVGELLFLQLPDSRWVFFSIFPGAVTFKFFTNDEMLSNDYLRTIVSLDPSHGGEGIDEVYDMRFFADKYGFNPKKANKYKGSDIRWNDIKTGLMLGMLYKDELANGQPVPEFMTNGKTYSLSYNTRDNKVGNGTVISTLNTSMRSVLIQSATALKTGLYTPSAIQKIAFFLVPFYKEIYHASTDKDYQPDVMSIMFDIIGVVGVAAQAGVKVGTIIKNTATLGKILQQGAKSGLSGKALKIYAIKELAKESGFSALKILKTGALATIDLVDPIAVKSLFTITINRINKTDILRKPFAAASSAGVTRGINKKYARTDIALESMKPQTVHGSTVYASAENAGKGPYFIKVEESIYEVRWDSAFETWRTVDPDNPNVLSFGVAIKQENNNWVVRNAENTSPAAAKEVSPGVQKATVPEARKTVMSAGLAPDNPVRAAARRDRYKESAVKESGDYAAQLLEDAKLLSSESASSLKAGLKQAFANPAKGTDELFSSSRIIESEEQLLRVKLGEILIFSEVDPQGKITRRVHVMVSIGNGRFAGIKNSVLGSSLNDSKSILTAEQLGEFNNNLFTRRGDDSLPALQIIAGDVKNSARPEYPSLQSLAENLTTLPDDTDIVAKTTGLLKQAGELAPEQASALQEKLTVMLKASKGGATIAGTTESLFSTAVKVTDRAALHSMEKGKMVVFGNASSPSFAAHHLMYSLGDGDFLMVNPHLLDKSLSSKNGIINASQFPDELFTKYGVLSGDVSLGRLRTTSLLGRDASFFVDGPILTVRLHGAPGIANFMDAYELAEVIKGLGLRESPPLKLGQIREIKLESCFGAFGFLPTGKALAHILGKKVTAYPFKFSNALRNTQDQFKRAKVYMPSDFPTADLITQIEKQQARNYDFWNRLLGMYAEIRGKRPVPVPPREGSSFNYLLDNVAELASGKTDAATFLQKTPDYKTGLAGDVSELETLCKGEVSDAEAFAQRCMDIITLSNNAAKQLHQHLGGEEE